MFSALAVAGGTEWLSRTKPAPVSVLIPAKNDRNNLERCLESVLGWASEIVVVDSQSTDGTVEYAAELGVAVIQFEYQGGWPKKRNWALDSHKWRNEWVLLLDADERLTNEGKHEMVGAIERSDMAGYLVPLTVVFLGRRMRHGDTRLWKLCLFRHRHGRFEQRCSEEDSTLCDMEVHEHVLVGGPVGRLRSAIVHENVESLYAYIEKHNRYSSWEVAAWKSARPNQLRPSLFGTQAQRRRWMRLRCLECPGFPLAVFIYTYILRLGFLDGRAGLIYATFRMIQFFHVKAKLFERRRLERCPDGERSAGRPGAGL